MKGNIGFVFPGQGSQKIGMGKELYNYKEGKEVFDEIDEALGFRLSRIIFEGNEEDLRKTENTQPALMCVSIAALRVLEKESAKKMEEICFFAAGHSVGEYSALCGAGCFSVKDTALLLRKRGRLMANAFPEGGAMVAVIGLSKEMVQEALEELQEKVVIANDNATGQLVLSGEKQAIEKAVLLCKKRNARLIVPLDVSGPFHSPLLESASLAMKEELQHVNIVLPKVAVISNLCVKKYTSVEEIRENLAKQIIGQVRWRETILSFAENNIQNIIEIGSGKVLCGLFKRTAPQITTLNIEDGASLLSTLKFLQNENYIIKSVI